MRRLGTYLPGKGWPGEEGPSAAASSLDLVAMRVKLRRRRAPLDATFGELGEPGEGGRSPSPSGLLGSATLRPPPGGLAKLTLDALAEGDADRRLELAPLPAPGSGGHALRVTRPTTLLGGLPVSAPRCPAVGLRGAVPRGLRGAWLGDPLVEPCPGPAGRGGGREVTGAAPGPVPELRRACWCLARSAELRPCRLRGKACKMRSGAVSGRRVQSSKRSHPQQTTG
eukprot:355101-Chlamydomonas_euryale.AAC.2